MSGKATALQQNQIESPVAIRRTTTRRIKSPKVCEITQKSSDNWWERSLVWGGGASAVGEHEQQSCQVVVPGQVMFGAYLSAAAEPGHLLGCLCALTRFFVWFCKFLTMCVCCWVLLCSAVQDSAAVLCSHLLFSAFWGCSFESLCWQNRRLVHITQYQLVSCWFMAFNRARNHVCWMVAETKNSLSFSPTSLLQKGLTFANGIEEGLWWHWPMARDPKKLNENQSQCERF